MRYAFDKVSYSQIVNVVCKSCGKKRQRTVKDWQTINPFNKNPDGSVKSRQDIYTELTISVSKKAAEFAENFTACQVCEKEGRTA